MATAGIPKFIGAEVKRREDPALVKGQGNYVSDIMLDGTLQMVILRSPMGHAKIESMDTTAAAAMSGVHAVWTAEDVAKHCDKPIPMIVDMDAFFSEYQTTPRRTPLKPASHHAFGSKNHRLHPGKTFTLA